MSDIEKQVPHATEIGVTHVNESTSVKEDAFAQAREEEAQTPLSTEDRVLSLENTVKDLLVVATEQKKTIEQLVSENKGQAAQINELAQLMDALAGTALEALVEARTEQANAFKDIIERINVGAVNEDAIR